MNDAELSTNIKLLANRICISDESVSSVVGHFNDHFNEKLPLDILTLYGSMDEIQRALLYLNQLYSYSIDISYIASIFRRKDYNVSPNIGKFLLAYIFLNRSYTLGDRNTLIRILLKAKVHPNIWNYIIEQMDEYFAGEKLEEVRDVLRSEYSRNKLINGMNGNGF